MRLCFGVAGFLSHISRVYLRSKVDVDKERTLGWMSTRGGNTTGRC